MNLQSREDDEERERLIKVVEYLEPFMSKQLLCKFPDNSAFDFNYSQSTIWSPLVPRPYHSMDLDVITPIKLPSDFEMATETTAEKNSLRKATSNLKKKLLFNGFSISFGISKSNRKMNRMKNKKLASDFSPTPLQGGACYPNNKKGWSKLLRAATKHFKKKKKKKDPTSQMKLYF
ncbi:uncharacterized protein LOC120085999 [Benincasa hispida]|uniref:uncharacterized protein LOC120085999 n=1 Tax=Benincasa hispida TaxID=102211 RepID=UPI0018FF335E|nr:uncharacterized protein LOC120085999 [Benincasa hispida]